MLSWGFVLNLEMLANSGEAAEVSKNKTSQARDAKAIFHQLSRRMAQDRALKVVAGMKPRTNADENAAVETNPLSTLPKFWSPSAAAAGGAGSDGRRGRKV